MTTTLENVGYDRGECMREIFCAIEQFAGRSGVAQERSPQPAKERECLFCPADAVRLLRDMRAYERAFVVRRLMEHLGMDESLPFQFRVDHKLIQGLLLNAFVPSASLPVIGFADALLQAEPGSLETFLGYRFPEGFVVKEVYGYNSDRSGVLRSETTVPVRVQQTRHAQVSRVEEEICFLQGRFDARREYRVHTFGRDVVPTLTRRTHGSVTLMGELERRNANGFVKETMDKLPDALVADSLCAWDIAEDKHGTFKIFEINYSGLHPVFEPGFHCSGNLQSYVDGTLNMARLLHFVRQRHRVRFVFELEPVRNPLDADAASTLYAVERWLDLLDITDRIFDLWNDSYNSSCSVNDVHGQIESIRGVVFANAGGTMERMYCEYLDWLKKMTDDLR